MLNDDGDAVGNRELCYTTNTPVFEPMTGSLGNHLIHDAVGNNFAFCGAVGGCRYLRHRSLELLGR
jgi:hypothetical protein